MYNELSQYRLECDREVMYKYCHGMHTCVGIDGIVSLRGAAIVVTVFIVVVEFITVSAPTLSNFWLLDGCDSVIESLSLLFTTEMVDGAVVVTLLVVNFATAVAINDADAVPLMTIF